MKPVKKQGLSQMGPRSGLKSPQPASPILNPTTYTPDDILVLQFFEETDFTEGGTRHSLHKGGGQAGK